MSTLNFHHAKMSVSQYNLKLFTLVLIYASRSHFFLVAQLQVLYHCLAPSSMSVNVEREEVFTIQGHEDSLEAVSMGFVVLCSLLSLIKLSLFFFFFFRLLIAPTYFVSIGGKKLCFENRGEGVCRQHNLMNDLL